MITKKFLGFCANCNLMVTTDEKECPGCGHSTEVTLKEMDPSKLPIKYDDRNDKNTKID